MNSVIDAYFLTNQLKGKFTDRYKAEVRLRDFLVDMDEQIVRDKHEVERLAVVCFGADGAEKSVELERKARTTSGCSKSNTKTWPYTYVA